MERFERLSESAIRVIEQAKLACQRLRGQKVGSEHLLLALASDQGGLAKQALSSMNITYQNILSEVERLPVGAEAANEDFQAGSTFAEVIKGCGKLALSEEQVSHLGLSEKFQEAFDRAQDERRYFGAHEVHPEHLLLAIIGLAEAQAIRILEELSANLSFLRQQVMQLMAQSCSAQGIPSLRDCLVEGLNELISKNLDAVGSLGGLALYSGFPVQHLPEPRSIVYMVLTGHLPSFLYTQVAFQRYLLQKSLNMLVQRTGSLDDELTAALISASAQHLRFEVRQTIEYLWSHKYRFLTQILDEAEHDLIGIAIEDLWWTHSEELALHELYDRALEDHRRKHVLNLQKRRLEIAERIKRLRARLKDSIRQCFLNRSVSA